MQKIQKPNYKNHQELTFRGQFIIKLTEMCIQFRNQRIQHRFVIFIFIWNRVVMGTYLNITRLSKQKTQFFNSINQFWDGIIQYITHTQLQVLNLIILVCFLLISILAMFWILFPHHSKKNSILIILFITFFNYVILRYFITLLLSIATYKYRALIQVLSIVNIVFLFLFQIIFWLISCTSKMRNQNLLTTQKKTLKLIKYIFIFFLIIVTQVCVNIQGQHQLIGLLINGLHLILSSLSLYCILSQFLYHSNFTEIVYETSIYFQMTVSFCVFIALLTNNQLFIQNIIFLIISIMFFMCMAGQQYIGYRNNQLIYNKDPSTRGTKNYLQILTHFLIDSSDGQKQQCLLNMLISQHQEECQNLECICQRKNITPDEKQELQKIVINNKLDSTMLSSSNFQIILICCYTKLIFLKSFADLLFSLNLKKNNKDFGILQQLEYQCLKKQIHNFLQQRKIEMNAIETQSIQKQDQVIIDFFHLMMSLSLKKEAFWFNLNRSSPLQSKLQQTLTQFLDFNTQCQQIIEKIYRQFSFSRLLLDFIALYQMSIRLKNYLPKKLKTSLRNCLKVKMQRNKLLKHNDFKLDLLMFEKKSVMFESKIQKNNMGIVLNVSKNIQQTFGYRKQMIIGENINVIMPKSMQNQHDFILQSWRQRCSWENINKIRYIFAMSKDRTCFSTAIYLRLIQKQQSVNIMASFIKANENDYMLINEDGIIDGLGINLKKLLGSDVTKLPFSMICQKANTIINECKVKGMKRTTKIHLYHIKGLQQLLDQYQQNKYQIVQSVQKAKISQKLIKVKQRLLKLCFSYEPYWMGRKFFVIFKFIENVEEAKKRKMNKYLSFNTSNAEGAQNDEQIIQTSTNENSKKQDLCEYNSSIQTSIHENSASHQIIFMELNQKSKKSTLKINSKKILKKLFIILSILISYLIIFGVQGYRFNIQSSMQNLQQVQRLFIKYNGLNLVYSDLINLQRVKGRGEQFEFLSQKASIQLIIIENTLINQNISQLITNTKNQFYANLTKNQIYFGNFFSKHLKIFNNLKNNNQKEQINFFMNQIRRSKINQSNQKAQNYMPNNIQTQVYQPRAFLGYYILAVFVLIFFCQKVAKIQNLHFLGILNIFIMISEKNCEVASNYYKNICNLLQKVNSQLKNHQNIPRRIEYYVQQNNNIISLLQKFQVSQERGSGKKQLIKNYQHSNSFKWIFFIASIFLASFIVKWNQEEHIIQQFIHQRDNYCSLTKSSIKIMNNHLRIKQIVSAESINQLDIITLRQNIQQFFKQKNQNNGFVGKFVQIFKQISPSLSQLHNNTVCQIMKHQNQFIHDRICKEKQYLGHNYSNLKIYQAHSLLMEYINQIASSILQKQNDWPKYRKLLDVCDKIITFQFFLIRSFFRGYKLKLLQINNQKKQIIRSIYFSFAIAFIILILSIFYYLGAMNWRMNHNCGKILIVPQILLKRTKGAMKCIEVMVNY